MSAEEQQARMREIAAAAAAKYPDETDFTYVHAEIPYTLQRLRIALKVCAGHLIENRPSVTLRALESMRKDAIELRMSDPQEFGASVLRGEEFARRRGLL